MLVAVSGGCRAFLSNPAVHLTRTRTVTITLTLTLTLTPVTANPNPNPNPNQVHRFLNRQWRGYALDLVLNQATNAVDNCWLAVFNHAHGDAITR